MNHHTHSGNSSTVISNPNAFDSRANKLHTLSMKKNQQRLQTHKSPHNQNGISITDRGGETSNHDKISIKTRPAIPIDFDALESIPFDDEVPNQLTAANITDTNLISNNILNDSNAPISAVFKKLTTYFSSNSSHKTLNKLKSMHHNHNTINATNTTSDNNQTNINSLTKPNGKRNEHKKFLKHNTENCAVFENCQAVTAGKLSVSSMESMENEFCSDDDTKSKPHPQQQQQQLQQSASSPSTPSPPPQHSAKKSKNHHHSSNRISSYSSSDCSSSNKSLSANKMYRDDDKYTMGNRTSAVLCSPTSNSRTTNPKRQKDLSSKIEKSSETFSLPRVSLRQR